MPRRSSKSPSGPVAPGATTIRPADDLFDRHGPVGHLLPFGILAVLAALSVLLPPGPSNRLEYLVSLGLMIVAGALVIPLERGAGSLRVIPPVVLAVSLALMTAAGNGNRGLDAALLLPVVWVALYARRWDVAVVICSLLAALLGAGLAVHSTTDTRTLLAGRIVLVGAAGSLIAWCLYGLRGRISRHQADALDSARRVVVMQSAARELSSIQSAAVVSEAAVRICGELLYASDARPRRAEFLRLIGKTVHIGSQFDPSGLLLEEPYPLSEHPYLRRAVETGDSFRSTIDLAAVGPSIGSEMDKAGVTHGAWIPIQPGRTVVGVIAISSRGTAVPIDLFEMCVTIGRIAELALASALASDDTQTKATTDELTGLANYLGFELFLDHRPHDRPYVLMALDIDGLRLINEGHGREVGDEVLVETANALRSVLRRGDLLARLDGDQFAAYLASSQLDDGRLVAGRMEEAIAILDAASPVSISIGIACGGPESDYQAVNEGAVAAMGIAKQSGGGRYAVLDGDRYFVSEPGEAPVDGDTPAESAAGVSREDSAGAGAGLWTGLDLLEGAEEPLVGSAEVGTAEVGAAEVGAEGVGSATGAFNGAVANGNGSNRYGSNGRDPRPAETDPVQALIDSILSDPALFDRPVSSVPSVRAVPPAAGNRYR